MGPYSWDNAKSLNENLVLLEAHQLKRIKEVRATPRRGPVLRPFTDIEFIDKGEAVVTPWLYPGRQRDSYNIGAGRTLKTPEWELVDADWRAVSGFSEPVPIVEDEPVKDEAVAEVAAVAA